MSDFRWRSSIPPRRHRNLPGRVSTISVPGCFNWKRWDWRPAMTAAIWEVRRDFGAVLKAMQRAQDRQRLLHVHGALLSDSRLQMVVTPIRRVGALDGRVLIHGEEETGRMYVLMEGTDAQVHYISHTAEITRAWSQGALRPNSFVRFRRMFGDDGRPFVEIADLGDADKLLKNRSLLRDLARESMPGESSAMGRLAWPVRRRVGLRPKPRTESASFTSDDTDSPVLRYPNSPQVDACLRPSLPRPSR